MLPASIPRHFPAERGRQKLHGKPDLQRAEEDGKLALAVCMHSHGPGAGRASPVFGKGPVGLPVGPVLSEMRPSRHFPLSIGQNQCEQSWTAGATSSRGLALHADKQVDTAELDLALEKQRKACCAQP